MEKLVKELKELLQIQIDQNKLALKILNQIKIAPADLKTIGTKPKNESGNSMWSDFVFSTFEKNQKLYTAPKLITLAKKQLDVKGMTESQIRLGIARVLSRHAANGGKLKTYRSENERASYYGLSLWFDGKRIKPNYSKKLA